MSSDGECELLLWLLSLVGIDLFVTQLHFDDNLKITVFLVCSICFTFVYCFLVAFCHVFLCEKGPTTHLH